MKISLSLKKNVVYCWSFGASKNFHRDYVCFKVEVDETRCVVAEMDYIGFAMMYKYGGKKFGGKNIPICVRGSCTRRYLSGKHKDIQMMLSSKS